MPDAVVEAVNLPFKEAIDFFRGKARVPTSHWTDVWRTAHSHAFMVAGAATDALLSDFQAAIQKALSDGTTLAEFRRDFDSIVEKHGWSYNGSPGWRSRIIYETNLSTAYSAGRYAQLTDPAALEAYPYWQYVHSGSRHPRVQHLAWNGLTLRADDGFWATHYPPNGWRCGCRVRPVSGAGLARMGKSGPDQAPPVETRAWTNPKTGQVHQVPVGIDPGFDYNPGLAWKQGGRRLPVTEADADDLAPVRRAPGGAGPAAPAGPASPAELRRFLKAPAGDLPVGRIAQSAQRALGAEDDLVQLSAATLEKQAVRHPDLTAEDYLRLPEMLAAPDLVLDWRERQVLLLRAGDRVLAAVVKTTEDRAANYVTTVYPAGRKTVRWMIRQGRIVAGTAKDL